MIEELLQLGLVEVLNTLLDCNQENATNEALGAVANMFCAEDEDLVERCLSEIGRPKLIEELLFRSTQVCF